MDKTLVKGLALLEALSAHDEPCGVTELADELGMSKSNTHRLLQTLLHLKYVRKDEAHGHYECTLKIWQVGAMLVRHPAMRPSVEALAVRTSETVHVAVLDGTDVVFIDKIDSLQAERAISSVGGRAPAHCMASGKCLLSYATQKQVAMVVTGGMKRYTPTTITDPAVLQKELRQARELGYAISRGEWIESACGLAAPILNAKRRAVAAIGISAPTERLSASRLRGLVPLVLEAARMASRAIRQSKDPLHR